MTNRYHFNGFGLTTFKRLALYLKSFSSQIRDIERENQQRLYMLWRTLKENDIRELAEHFLKLSSDILQCRRAGQRDTAVSKRCAAPDQGRCPAVFTSSTSGSGGPAGKRVKGPGQVLRKAPVLGIPRAQTWRNVKVDTLVLLDPLDNWITGLEDQSTV